MTTSQQDLAIVAMPMDMEPAKRLADQLRVPLISVELGRFPDGETKLHLKSAAPTSILYCSLYAPDPKIFPLILASSVLRRLGSRSITLVAPYLCYMRQDKAFRQGEPISQRVLGKVLSPWIDHIVTVEPHLHRTRNLDDVFVGVKTTALSAAPLFRQLIGRDDIDGEAIVIGPDEEAFAWTKAVAEQAGIPFATMSKKRLGDRDVKLELDPAISVEGRHVILIDDVVSTGGTLAAAARLLQSRGCKKIEALVAHALCKESEIAKLKQAGVSRLRSTDAIPHPTNAIEIAPLLADALRRELSL